MLKYLFEAEYKDGSVFNQGKEDVSSQDEKRSAYYDVKQDELIRFSLVGEHRYTVDLRDGHFEIDGIPFLMHEEELSDYRLIFFRRHTHHFNPIENRQTGHEVTYRIGWQSTKDGKNHQEVMEIN